MWSSILGQDFSHDWRAANCKYEPLPSSLNTVSYLNFNNEFHVQGEYFVNITQSPILVPFNISVQSIFKIYVAPHEVDVDIYLWRINANGARTLLAASLDIGTEEAIFQNLIPGSYRFDLKFLILIFLTIF